jgi:hypothetical protein
MPYNVDGAERAQSKEAGMGIKIRLVEGTPLSVGKKKLRPVVRVISWNRRGAAVRQKSLDGFGMAAVWLQPVAVIEETDEGHCRIPVRDETIQAMLGLLVVMLVVPLALNLLVQLIRLKNNSKRVER